MHFTYSHHFAANVEDVIAMFADDDFVQRRAQSSGDEHGDALLSGSVAEGFTVSIRRVVPSTSIPQEFRGFVGSDLSVRYTEVWEPNTGGTRQGTFSVEIVGAPGHASGNLSLIPSDGGTDLELEGSVSVRIPLFGSMIEKSLVKSVSTGLEDELAVADEWLASRA
ncbi:DUF2505 domain-containing protein [Demequina sp. B12]|uniref:DUF2505 domain-containing protein n=1 Tax=Demequina sp. B12 TaxID=2992757 RepID=UPI00237C1691|nr:DUF2505 domain-containing protein [Demequina sp. B12]MDE0572575.1 DUF2505 domain-containing protein [Demequina sp. B12]